MADLQNITTVPALRQALWTDPALEERLRADPMEVLDHLGAIPDTRVYRWVVWFLGSSILISLLGGILLFWSAKDIPDLLVMVASGALGALAGLLAPQPQ